MPAVKGITAGFAFGLIGWIVMMVLLGYIHYQTAIRSFSLILQVPDRVMRWFGQGGENLGEDRDSDQMTGVVVGQVSKRAESLPKLGAVGMAAGMGGGKGARQAVQSAAGGVTKAAEAPSASIPSRGPTGGRGTTRKRNGPLRAGRFALADEVLGVLYALLRHLPTKSRLVDLSPPPGLRATRLVLEQVAAFRPHRVIRMLLPKIFQNLAVGGCRCCERVGLVVEIADPLVQALDLGIRLGHVADIAGVPLCVDVLLRLASHLGHEQFAVADVEHGFLQLDTLPMVGI